MTSSNEPNATSGQSRQVDYRTPRLIDNYRVVVEGRQLSTGQLEVFTRSCSPCLGAIAAAARTLVRVGLGELPPTHIATWSGAALVAREFSS